LCHRLSSGVNRDGGIHLGVEWRECQLSRTEGSRLSEDRNQTVGVQHSAHCSWHLQKPMPLLCRETRQPFTSSDQYHRTADEILAQQIFHDCTAGPRFDGYRHTLVNGHGPEHAGLGGESQRGGDLYGAEVEPTDTPTVGPQRLDQVDVLIGFSFDPEKMDALHDPVTRV